MASGLSVVVVHHRGRDILLRCLESLAAQLEPAFEVVLVANGVTDGSLDGQLPCVPGLRHVTLEQNAGFAGGANAGIRASAGDLVALLNDDAQAEPGWIAAMLEASRRYPWAASFASRMLFADGSNRIDSAGDILTAFGEGANRGRGEPDGPRFDCDCEVFGVCAGAGMYRRALFDRVGLFDETFFHTCEDFDLAVRARLAGERAVYVAGARVHHVGAATRGHDSPDSTYLQARNSEFVYWADLPSKVLARTLPWHLARNLWGIVAKGRLGLAVPYVHGKLAALAHLPRLIGLRRRRLAGRVADLGDQVDREWHLARLHGALHRLRR